MKEKQDVEHELETLQATTIQKMWLRELDDFEKVYDIYVEKRKSEYSCVSIQGEGAKSKKTITKKTIKK